MIDIVDGNAYLDVSNIMSGAISHLDIDEKIDISFDGLVDNINTINPVIFTGVINNISGYINIKGTIDCNYKTECARCLEEIEGHLQASIDKSLCNSGCLEDEDSEDVIINYLIIDDNKINLTQLCKEELAFEMPYRVLCKEDCKGLCQKCGCNLNHEQCNCDFKEIDPRLEKLRELLK